MFVRFVIILLQKALHKAKRSKGEPSLSHSAILLVKVLFDHSLWVILRSVSLYNLARMRHDLFRLQGVSYHYL